VGTAGKNRDVLRDFSVARVKRLSGLQKKMISSAWKVLKPGGVLVYSTCTTTIEENEEVIEHLLGEHEDAKIQKINFKDLECCGGLTDATRFCTRILPQHAEGESYFIARVVKSG